MPIVVAVLAQIISMFGWSMAYKKEFEYDEEKREASWLKNGERVDYKWQPNQHEKNRNTGMDNFFLIIFAFIVMLIIVHAIISRRKGNHENNGGIPRHWAYPATLLISFLLLFTYSAGVCWLFYSDISWPHVGSLSSVFLFVLCPGIVFQTFFLVYSLTKRKLPAKRIWARFFSILLGLFWQLSLWIKLKQKQWKILKKPTSL